MAKPSKTTWITCLLMVCNASWLNAECNGTLHSDGTTKFNFSSRLTDIMRDQSCDSRVDINGNVTIILTEKPEFRPPVLSATMDAFVLPMCLGSVALTVSCPANGVLEKIYCRCNNATYLNPENSTHGNNATNVDPDDYRPGARLRWLVFIPVIVFLCVGGFLCWNPWKLNRSREKDAMQIQNL